MLKVFAKYLSLVLLVVLAGACSEPEPVKAEDPSGFDGRKFPKYDINAADNTPGLIGVYDVPEMLSLCRLDSGSMAEISGKVVEDFSAMEKDLDEIGATLRGPQGMIYYSSDPRNFKFETVLLIDKMPAKTPKNCQIVVLEASYMLVYNHFGPYEEAFKIYEVLRKYMNDNFLEQSGPAREFYPSMPTDTPPDQLLTRILVPVKRVKP